jgi:nicotinate dehydrogenase subunit A
VADFAGDKSRGDSRDDARIEVTLNGQPRAIVANVGTPLLYILRDDCGLTGTRYGCGAGECGACHVLVSGVSVPSCDTPLGTLQGKSVVTVEGLGPADGLSALQQAFVDEQAAQCGYCLSGILISAAALLKANPDPGEAQVRAALDAHLCRCGSHNRIVRAVLRASHALRVAA